MQAWCKQAKLEASRALDLAAAATAAVAVAAAAAVVIFTFISICARWQKMDFAT